MLFSPIRRLFSVSRSSSNNIAYQKPNTADVVVIGGGVIGLACARELNKRLGGGKKKVIVLEKESISTMHASGRNSGVLHAGFYYPSTSLKAKFCRQGNLAWHSFCEEHKLHIHKCGKIVVPRPDHPDDLNSLRILNERGLANGVPVELIDEKEALEIEPSLRRGITQALWSPSTSSVDPRQCVQTLASVCQSEGVQLMYNTPFVSVEDGGGSLCVRTGPLADDKIHTGFVLNAAGLYADKVARAFGCGAHYKILPFKGLYLKTKPTRTTQGGLRRHVYPVPSFTKNPFLGIHYTLTADGYIKVGPTAIPTLWREQYEGLSNFSAQEFADILGTSVSLCFDSTFGFLSLAVEQPRNYFKSHMLQQASQLVDIAHFPLISVSSGEWKWAPAGIRAQLVDTRSRSLVMDFCVEKHENNRSLHILNTVSPGFTCTEPMAKHIVDMVI